MITWMQRHKKWLIITIWISTIAFVGAGFVGWGQYSYGDKAGAVAKVGNIEITQGSLQKSYSRLYAKYNEMFQGNFDEEKAKQFELQKQALEGLVQQALLLNLAASYDLELSDEELISSLTKQEYFFKDGVFDKESYKILLSQNNLSTKEYEADLRKDLLIQKLLKLLPVQTSENEVNILNTLMNITDKINYKVLSLDDIKIDTSDALLKPFWETSKNNFMSAVSYDVKYITQEKITQTYNDGKISNYYNDNKTHFKDDQGKILSLDSAKDLVITELNTKATKDKALRTYISYKKGKLASDIVFKSATLSTVENSFDAKTLEKISKLSLTSPYMKPVLVNGVYHTFELIRVNPSMPKSYEDAKADLVTVYTTQTKKTKLQELANNSIATFKGTNTPFITSRDIDQIKGLTQAESTEFLQKLFVSDKKRSYIVLNSKKIVLYYILEQKLLDKSNNDLASSVKKLKSSMFNKALIKTLENKYQTEIFLQGL
ncbi:Peptidyl-prolyl cis-trans isomerase PpiD [hydrothermal vent metagenome]|uniref:Peptidyl-prolyl cis-trans isomerase PpiD n=1 Tax=hydrothermal vent metagenome TaxID=652676 RepID=A0A1W1BSE4_9ZZZZ